MKNRCIFFAGLLLFMSVTAAYPEETGPFEFRKEPGLQQIRPRKPVRIKLKRTATGTYSWDLSGDDTDEILKVDKKLRKMLNVK